MMRRRPSAILLAAALAACASANLMPKPGASMSEVEAQLGKPKASYDRPGGGKQLEFNYVRGPYTYMVYFDAAGRMVESVQALNETNFRNVVDNMPKEQVLMLIGHPTQVAPGGRQGGQVWSYMYPNVQCLWYQVSIGADGRTLGPGTTAQYPPCANAP